MLLDSQRIQIMALAVDHGIAPPNERRNLALAEEVVAAARAVHEEGFTTPAIKAVLEAAGERG